VFLFGIILCSIILGYILYDVALRENNDVIIMGANVNEETKIVELKVMINNRKIMEKIKAGSFLGVPIEIYEKRGLDYDTDTKHE
jgi:hypothetical protein